LFSTGRIREKTPVLPVFFLLFCLSLFIAASLKEREDQGANKEDQENNLHGAEGFFALHKFLLLHGFRGRLSPL
jgi:hypothetical protein